MSTAETYDRIGVGYAAKRQPDPRWQERIEASVRGARTLVNVGAGAGSYEPTGPSVVAVEPSRVMIGQRPAAAAPALRAVAGALPFRDGAFDASLAVLTVHHWPDAAAGLAEMRRVSRRQVVVTWDPEVFAREFWFGRDYLPEAAERERLAGVATATPIAEWLRPARTEPLPVPADCTDGFFGAYWRRPEAYLDPRVRAAISAFALLEDRLVNVAVERLRRDLESGAWEERYGALHERDEIDLGYRLVLAGDAA